MNRSRILIYVAVVFLTIGMATEIFASPYARYFRGMRPMGMGGAFTAVSDDKNAIFYNPAGLSQISNISIGIFDPILSVSGKSIDLIQDAGDTDFDDTEEIADLLRKYVGDPQHFSATLTPSIGFRIKKFGVMVSGLGSTSFEAEIRNPVWPEAHVTATTDMGLLGGVGFAVPGVEGLRIGTSLKLMRRGSLDEVYTPADFASDDFEDRFEDDYVFGNGASLDLGVLYTLPWKKWFRTDLGMTVQHLPSMGFDDAVDMDTQTNMGLALIKPFAGFKLIAALDYVDVTKTLGNDTDFGKRIHAGVELITPVFISVRTGINQGYFTAGANVDIGFFRFELATYAEEVGTYAGQREDRRYMGQLYFGWE